MRITYVSVKKSRNILIIKGKALYLQANITLNRITMKQKLLMIMLLTATTLSVVAQEECFIYDGSDHTVITGLTELGIAATSLTIPPKVTKVSNYSLSDASSLKTLTIGGGNPVFDANTLEEVKVSLATINMGNGMTVANMKTLLESLNGYGNLQTVSIDGYADGQAEAFSNINWTDMTVVLPSDVQVNIPAELVGSQVFGDAQVYGRFDIGETQELKTFCGSATFLDENDGGNMLFYVPTGLNDAGQVHIQRVWYVKAGEGVLIHRTADTSATVFLKRVTGSYTADAHYASNMLKGVIEPTVISSTEGDYTNYILYQARFRPTSGGTLGANRAYLRIKTSDLVTARELSVTMEEHTTGIRLTPVTKSADEGRDYWYDLNGRRVINPRKGIFVHHGRKEVVR